MKTKTKNLIVFVLIFLLAMFIAFMPKILESFQKSKKIPVDVSYKRFEKLEKELNSFADKYNFEFSSHGDEVDDSCYRTIMLDSDNDCNITCELDNFQGIEEYVISIGANQDNTNVFTLIDYDMIDEVFEIIFDESYKDKLKEMSGELSNVNRDGAGKTMYLDRKNDITAYYVLHYGYKSKGVKSGNYISSLVIEKK